MYNVNPMQLVMMIKNGYNPQQLLMSILETNMAGTPMGDNLLYLARNNQTDEIEKIARNLVTQQGKDFDKEFMAFKRALGLK